MAEKLKEAFGVCFGLPVEDFPGERLAGEEISRLAERFSSWDWKYGRQIPFSKETEERFSWGEMRIQLRVDGGRIQETRLFTDALMWNLRSVRKNVFQARCFRKRLFWMP